MSFLNRCISRSLNVNSRDWIKVIMNLFAIYIDYKLGFLKKVKNRINFHLSRFSIFLIFRAKLMSLTKLNRNIACVFCGSKKVARMLWPMVVEDCIQPKLLIQIRKGTQ